MLWIRLWKSRGFFSNDPIWCLKGLFGCAGEMLRMATTKSSTKKLNYLPNSSPQSSTLKPTQPQPHPDQNQPAHSISQTTSQHRHILLCSSSQLNRLRAFQLDVIQHLPRNCGEGVWKPDGQCIG
jgi:hypothetical protein